MILAVTSTALAAADEGQTADSTSKAARVSEPLPPPPQMQELDFLLGAYTCVYDVPGQNRQKTFYATTKRQLNGHYYETRVLIPEDNLRSRQSFGWNPVDGKYFSQFHDDWGSSGTSESPGAEDGVFTFSGPYLLVRKPSGDGHAIGDRMSLKDEVKPLGPGHYQDVQTLTYDSSGFTFSLTYDCELTKAEHGE